MLVPLGIPMESLFTEDMRITTGIKDEITNPAPSDNTGSLKRHALQNSDFKRICYVTITDETALTLHINFAKTLLDGTKPRSSKRGS